ncbi:MAG: S-adenosylmethionine decarboxylase [bacterium]
MKKIFSFGLHLMLDFYGCAPKLLGDKKLCYDLLDKLPPFLGMQALTPPFVINAPGNEERGGKDPGGFSCYIIIAESHISLHTFVKRGFVSIDVYSCKEFDSNFATKYFEDAFKPEGKEVNLINRGSYYPPQNTHF